MWSLSIAMLAKEGLALPSLCSFSSLALYRQLTRQINSMGFKDFPQALGLHSHASSDTYITLKLF